MTEHLEALTKIALYSGLLLLIGALTSRWLLAIDAAPPNPGLERLFGRMAVAASAAIVLGLVARLFAHTASTFEGEPWTWDHVALIAFRSRWGAGWSLQALAATAACVAALLGRRPSAVALVAVSLAAVAVAAVFPLLGHAAGSATREMLATAHLLGGGVWLGTLVALVLTRHHGSLWSWFSSVAFGGASIVGLSGLVMASTYLQSWRDMLTTPYGRVFALKMAVFLGVLFCGALNWRAVRQSGQPPTARVEAVLAMLIVVVTAFLTEMAHP